MDTDGTYFPVFINMAGRRVLIVGAGKIASRRAAVLADYGAVITVIAPEGTEEMQNLADAGKVRWMRERFEDCVGSADQEKCSMVLAATDDDILNSGIVHWAKMRGIPANHAGDHRQCDYYFPAIVQDKELVLGMISKSRDHGYVRQTAAKLRAWLKINN